MTELIHKHNPFASKALAATVEEKIAQITEAVDKAVEEVKNEITDMVNEPIRQSALQRAMKKHGGNISDLPAR